MTSPGINDFNETDMIRAAAEKYGASPATVQRAVKQLISAAPAPVMGRPPVSNSRKNEAIFEYIVWMQQGDFAAAKSKIEAAAITPFRRRDPDAPILSIIWCTRWIEAHSYLRKMKIKMIE